MPVSGADERVGDFVENCVPEHCLIVVLDERAGEREALTAVLALSEPLHAAVQNLGPALLDEAVLTHELTGEALCIGGVHVDQSTGVRTSCQGKIPKRKRRNRVDRVLGKWLTIYMNKTSYLKNHATTIAAQKARDARREAVRKARTDQVEAAKLRHPSNWTR